jgi:hypothetical protein
MRYLTANPATAVQYVLTIILAVYKELLYEFAQSNTKLGRTSDVPIKTVCSPITCHSLHLVRCACLMAHLVLPKLRFFKTSIRKLSRPSDIIVSSTLFAMSSLSGQLSDGKLCQFCLEMFDTWTDAPWHGATRLKYHQSLPSFLLSIEEQCGFCTQIVRLLPGRNENDAQLQWDWERLDIVLTTLVRESPLFEGVYLRKSPGQSDPLHDIRGIANHIEGFLFFFSSAPEPRATKTFCLTTMSSFEGWSQSFPPYQQLGAKG